eukprot:TRINITY_DN11610_c0_g1_i1.p1 TRINITY_DN11610_c0_g1~~TRINITY_DN11610_c0_g1_i1.p1  ORF type:complete len:507 (-),score=79.41 TRINITY_DN11610_c0_g1_i1:30-1550(-)
MSQVFNRKHAQNQDVRNDPACWHSCLTNTLNLDPLHFSFLRLKFIAASYFSVTTVESMLVFLLLVETALKCDFVKFYVTANVPVQIVATTAFSFFSGFLVDKTEPYAHRVLNVACIISLVLDPLLFFLGLLDPRLVVTFFVMRYCSALQVGNSATKIFKLRLKKLSMKEEHQVPAFVNFNVTSDVVGRSFILIVMYFLGLILIKENLLHFMGFKNLCFFLMVIIDTLALIVSLTIKQDYFYDKYFDGEDEVDPLIKGTKSSSLCQKIVSIGVYTRDSTKKFWRNGVLCHLNAHILMIVILTAFVNLILKFDVSGAGTSKNKTRENFCGGQVTNLIEIQAFSELSRIAGAAIIQLILMRLAPSHYFRKFFQACGVVLSVLFLLVLFKKDMGNTASSIILGCLNAMFYMLSNYDNCLVGTVVQPEILGFAFALQGSVIQVAGLFPIAVADLLNTTTTVIVLIAFTLFIMAYTLAFSRVYSARIKELDDETKIETDPNCFTEYCLGYGA